MGVTRRFFGRGPEKPPKKHTSSKSTNIRKKPHKETLKLLETTIKPPTDKPSRSSITKKPPKENLNPLDTKPSAEKRSSTDLKLCQPSKESRTEKKKSSKRTRKDKEVLAPSNQESKCREKQISTSHCSSSKRQEDKTKEKSAANDDASPVSKFTSSTGKSAIVLDNPPVRVDPPSARNHAYYTPTQAEYFGFVPVDLLINRKEDKENICPKEMYRSVLLRPCNNVFISDKQQLNDCNQQNLVDDKIPCLYAQFCPTHSCVDTSQQNTVSNQQNYLQQPSISNQEPAICDQQPIVSNLLQILAEPSEVASSSEAAHEATTNRLFKEILDKKVTSIIKKEYDCISSIETLIIHQGWGI